MSKLLGSLLPNIIPPEHMWKLRLLGHWQKIIGKLKEKVRIEKINQNILVLGVCHPAWAQELYLLSPMLKKKINNFLQEEKIKVIQFRTVPFETKKSSTAPSQKKSYASDPLDPKQLEHCLTIAEHSSLQTVQNQELAHALEKFCIRCKKTKK